MADLLKMDPARIARLRDPARLALADPERVLTVTAPLGDGPIVDVGAGVGYVALPFARRFPTRRVIAADVLPGMLALLDEAAASAGLANLETALMPGPATVPVPAATASLAIMLQVHHELDDPIALLQECRRILAPGAPIVIVDWRAENQPGIPQGGRRVPQTTIAEHLAAAGFAAIANHDLYPAHSTTIGTAPA